MKKKTRTLKQKIKEIISNIIFKILIINKLIIIKFSTLLVDWLVILNLNDDQDGKWVFNFI